MIRKIQVLIRQLQYNKSEADSMAEANYKVGHYGIGGLYKERSKAYDFCIEQLTLLLDSENEKSSQSSQEDTSNSSNAM